MDATSPKGDDLRGRARENVRSQIAQVAFGVFAERGFDNVTATEVAKAAGVSRASFFRYFESKEDAVFVAQEALVGAALGALDAASTRWAESDGDADLIGLLDEAFAVLAEPFPALGIPADS